METLSLVIVGHVDHGKSTLTARLLLDTGSLPQGKLESIRERCLSKGKKFEYAFLLDALKEEQSQGITIEATRLTFQTSKRLFKIIDAPGHLEFLKNMVTGASRAEAAILVVDAHEGIKENSRRHAILLSFLGIKQIIVAVNKMDLIDWSETRFNEIKSEVTSLFTHLSVEQFTFIPVSAFEGGNVVQETQSANWFTGPSVLQALELMSCAESIEKQDFAFQIQDTYLRSVKSGHQRILAGQCTSGNIKPGDEVLFFPSMKKSRVIKLAGFPEPPSSLQCGESGGLIIADPLYVSRGEIAAIRSETRFSVGRSFRASVLWLGQKPLFKNRQYILKMGSLRLKVKCKDIIHRLNTSTLDISKSGEAVLTNEMSLLNLQCENDLPVDLVTADPTFRRFVLIDEYDICGAGFFEQKISEINHTEVSIKQVGQVILCINSDESKARQLAHDQLARLTELSEKVALLNAEEDREASILFRYGFQVIIPSTSLCTQDRETFIRTYGAENVIFLEQGKTIQPSLC